MKKIVAKIIMIDNESTITVEIIDISLVFIFNVATIEEAEQLVKTDPAVEAGVLDYELVKLYSSAALMKINEIHHSIQKTGIE